MSVDLKGRVECQRVIYIYINTVCLKKRKKRFQIKKVLIKKVLNGGLNFFVN